MVGVSAGGSEQLLPEHRCCRLLNMVEILLFFVESLDVGFEPVVEAGYLRLVSSLDACHILTYHSSLLLAYVPLVCGDILEIEIPTGVGDVASDGDWVEPAVADSYVPESNIFEGHERLCDAAALGIERIEHATGSVTVRLFHLLWSDIYRPPLRSKHRKVLIDNVGDNSVACVSWVGLDVDALKGILHVDVAESNILNAVLIVGG